MQIYLTAKLFLMKATLKIQSSKINKSCVSVGGKVGYENRQQG
jgi:hypothetical protein